MARPAKPSKIVTSHRSTEEKENRKRKAATYVTAFR